MVKIIIIILFTLLSFFLFLLPKNVYSAESIQITDTISSQPSQSEGEVFFSKTLNFDYKGEKVVFSGTSDGVGSTVVFEAVDIVVTNADGIKTRFIDSFM